MSHNDLEDRLVQFTVTVLQLSEQLPNTKIEQQLSLRIIKSSTAASINYARAQSAETRKVFVQQLKIVLKELRKTNDQLKMIDSLSLLDNSNHLELVLKEADELVAIFITSVRTAMQNDALAKRMNQVKKYPKKLQLRKDK
jgi:four helix bundle protein